jgi:hypothetical protein
MGRIYDEQADRAICEFCYENIELAEYDLRAAWSSVKS